MIITSSSGEPGAVPACPPGTTLVASVDVEWTKNYRVANGNIPFCYSVVWLAVPSSGTPMNLGEAPFSLTSAYVENPAETQDLIASAEDALTRIVDHAGLITGHQLCSDLAVLAQLSAQLRAARQHSMIIADKTIANVLAYARIVLPAPAGSRQAAVLTAMEAFCRAWAPLYDVVFYCCDTYAQQQAGDPYRAKVLDLQSAAGRVVRQTCAATGQHIIDIPPGMTTAERVAWVTARAAKLGITAAARP